MTPAQLLERFRRDVDDIKLNSHEEDVLFTDEEIMDYMDEAHRRLVAESLYYHTKLELPVTAGEADIPLPTIFLDLRGKMIYLKDAGTPLFERSLSQFTAPVEDYGSPVGGNPFDTTYQQRPRLFSLDVDSNMLRLWPTPAEEDMLVVPAFVEPPSVVETGEFVLENRFHVLKLLSGMKALAYAKQDADSYDPNQAQRWEQQFERDILDLGSERMRRRRKPQVVRYGGL